LNRSYHKLAGELIGKAQSQDNKLRRWHRAQRKSLHGWIPQLAACLTEKIFAITAKNICR
jgi:hypothetical protein